MRTSRGYRPSTASAVRDREPQNRESERPLIYSSACEYAIRAASYLAARRKDGETLVKLKEIADAQGLPAPYLSSILQRLVTSGLLRSAKGPTGGYGLQSPPEQVTLHDIKAIMDGTADLKACAAGLNVCSDDAPCPLHDTWKPIREQIETYLKETTLEDMAEALAKKGVVPLSPGSLGDGLPAAPDAD